MLIVSGLAYLAFIVFLVKVTRAANVQPYFLMYLAVIAAGMWGASAIQAFYGYGAQNMLLAGLHAVFALLSMGVIVWGLSEFKQIHMRSSE